MGVLTIKSRPYIGFSTKGGPILGDEETEAYKTEDVKSVSEANKGRVTLTFNDESTREVYGDVEEIKQTVMVEGDDMTLTGKGIDKASDKIHNSPFFR